MTAVDNALLAGAGAGRSDGAVAANGRSVSDLFMTLLVAQIRNQDPLSPMESKDFVNQFASMSQVETMQTLSSLTSSSAALQESMLVVNLGAQVGSDIMVAAAGVSLGADPVQGAFVLDAPAAEVAVLLTGADGSTRRIELGAHDAGTVQFSIDPRKLGLPAGRYALRIEAGTGEAPRAELQGRLLGVRLDAQGQVVLDVAGVGEVGTGDISRFLGRSGGTRTPSQQGA
ncbi:MULTISPECIES: flagellar hook capping FlgD N-terminal domain-containing protein [Pseudoxanthomonas]|jgi:Flagellar hook capping protein|uniref:Basal-body rod modification protein FlgD n=1 Tax=Pseudoxanthomonas taiwanensis J19 TaxID=935569 RepID=A0A562D121_9GAMM|nr:MULTISPECIES: flagellar hook capping FlgD N-terminal domain-containing protein [Pseudoxanthomonas]TWH03403.1 flagellar basal-body rod modification protein FlgD [Pseudoxanthomonas taiwanensis J19]